MMCKKDPFIDFLAERNFLSKSTRIGYIELNDFKSNDDVGTALNGSHGGCLCKEQQYGWVTVDHCYRNSAITIEPATSIIIGTNHEIDPPVLLRAGHPLGSTTSTTFTIHYPYHNPVVVPEAGRQAEANLP